ncbi:hypothetical protein V490_00276 [Pseudogymnoascus sp. VKM F-3557]|nr:hypothetical protein V490_00276 [Pseudogymnoascus sp. VKM F-3557]
MPMLLNVWGIAAASTLSPRFMMATVYNRQGSNPLVLPEIVRLVVDNVHMVPDLLSCACVNSTWSVAALEKLYKGSLNDMQFRTPDIGSLNCLFVASQERFRRNMTFVKHLLLASENPAVDGVALPDIRLICNEKCRAMRHRQSAELLLQPQGAGLASLIIPFEIEGQDWSRISDLLLPRTVEFLAIDDYYCGLLMTGSDCFQGITPALTESDAAELLSCLRRQENLKALALTIPNRAALLGSSSTTLTSKEQGRLWPKLKMLYLGVADQHWLEQFPKFEKLQILKLEKPISHNFIEKIAKCRLLRVIDVVFNELNEVEALFDIARGCPLLQKFSVRHVGIGFAGEPELAENLCVALLRALPRLEHLELNLWFQMDGARLLDLARHCPRLTVLALPQTRLCLSLALLTNARSFWHLEIMHFASISFENPRRLMESDSIQAIATKWSRIFPKLRGMPCPTDIYSSYMQEDDLNGDSEGDGASVSADEEMLDLNEESERDWASVSADEELSLSVPGLGFDDYESDWFILRTKLWKVLGYAVVNDKIENMWQKRLEIETIGWPVVP